MADASRSKSSPVVVRASQPRPTCNWLRPGAAFVRLTLPPFDSAIAIGFPLLSLQLLLSNGYPTAIVWSREGEVTSAGAVYEVDPPVGRVRPCVTLVTDQAPELFRRTGVGSGRTVWSRCTLWVQSRSARRGLLGPAPGVRGPARTVPSGRPS